MSTDTRHDLKRVRAILSQDLSAYINTGIETGDIISWMSEHREVCLLLSQAVMDLQDEVQRLKTETP
mgnify:CR=1 FL=1